MKSKKTTGEANKAPVHKGEKREKDAYRPRKNKAGTEKTVSEKSREKKKAAKPFSPRNTKKKAPVAPDMPVRVIPLGGLGEIGKNMTALECGDDIIVIDCGMGFPDDGMLGIDLVIPDTSYLEKNKEKLRGIFVTHGHEDHIGAIPYVLRKLDVPIYGTKLTLGIVRNKLIEFDLDRTTDFRIGEPGDRIRAGVFEVEFISVNHSIADAVAFAIHTPCGVMIFTGDFKIDPTPIDGEMTDLTRFGELGREGVTALFCDSTNCERPGFTPSERTVGASLEHIFEGNKKRVIVATFSSNVHRMQQIIDTSIKYERAVCILGRSMKNVVSTASELGYMKIPDGVLIEPEELKKLTPDHATLITTGSQGEAMSALSRMAQGTHASVKLSPEDMVVISAHPIPGNEKTINNIINLLIHQKVSVVYDQIAEVHVSGHACQEEIKMIFALTKPRFFIPVHGEYKHLERNARLAEYAGIERERIFLSEIGKVLEFSDHGKNARFAGTVPAGNVLVDGLGVGDVGSVVLHDRKLLSEEGIITIVAVTDSYGKFLMSDVQVISRGFVYVKENNELMEEIRDTSKNAIESALEKGLDGEAIRGRTKDAVAKLLFARTGRRPMIVPVIFET